MNNNDNKVRKIVDGIIARSVDVSISSNVDMDDCHIDVLWDLNKYAVNYVLSDDEVIRDPRKIAYKANYELKVALVAICLSQSMVNPMRRAKENKEFFEDNISIETRSNGVKFISFGKVESENVRDALFWEIAEDWKIFRDKEGHGIRTLVDEKTNLAGLGSFKGGGDIYYEFARFQRKYTEKERQKEEKARESAQEAFRNAMVQSIASEVAKQQLLEGKNPMELVEMLFAPQSRNKNVKRLPQSSQKVDPQVEKSISLLLEYDGDK